MRKFLRQNKMDIIIILLTAGIVSIPLMTDYVLVGSSTALSLAHIENIYKFIGKAFPIRVGSLGRSVYGYSAAAFQADVFYIIPALMRVCGISLGSAFKITLFIFNVLTAAISYACYRKCFGNGAAGIVTSILYTWCPYRITSLYTFGNLSEVFAWTFIPIVILGLWNLYDESAEHNKQWEMLVLGISLITVSSSVFLFAISLLCAAVFLLKWKKSFRMRVIKPIIKTIIVVLGINAWYLIPMLLRMRNAEAVGVMITDNIREYGLYFAQYMMLINFPGNATNVWRTGMAGAPAFGPGFAAIGLCIIFLWWIFIGKSKFNADKEENNIIWGYCFVVLGGLFIVLSTNAFPWDIFQNKNMLFSIMLAIMENPSRLGIVADVCIITVSGVVITQIQNIYGRTLQYRAALLVAAISFGTTQYLLGMILKTQSIAWEKDVVEFGNIEMPMIATESLLWRMTELVSLLSIFVVIAVLIIRRKKGVK